MRYRTSGMFGILFFHVSVRRGIFWEIFKVLHSIVLHLPPPRFHRKMLRLNPGLLRRRHWRSDARRLDLILGLNPPPTNKKAMSLSSLERFPDDMRTLVDYVLPNLLIMKCISDLVSTRIHICNSEFSKLVSRNHIVFNSKICAGNLNLKSMRVRGFQRDVVYLG